jgi:hypothetical protein
VYINAKKVEESWLVLLFKNPQKSVGSFLRLSRATGSSEWCVEQARAINLPNTKELIDKFELTGNIVYWDEFIRLLREVRREKPVAAKGCLEGVTS